MRYDVVVAWLERNCSVIGTFCELISFITGLPF